MGSSAALIPGPLATRGVRPRLTAGRATAAELRAHRRLNRGPLLRGRAARSAGAGARRGAEAGATLSTAASRAIRRRARAGIVNVTMSNAAVGTRAAWVVDPEATVVSRGADAGRGALRAGSRRSGSASIRGYLAGGTPPGRGGQRVERRLRSTSRRSPSGSAGDALLLDVREHDEWEEGHVAGRCTRPTTSSPTTARGSELDGRPIAVACPAGIAARWPRRCSSAQASTCGRGRVSNLLFFFFFFFVSGRPVLESRSATARCSPTAPGSWPMPRA